MTPEIEKVLAEATLRPWNSDGCCEVEGHASGEGRYYQIDGPVASRTRPDFPYTVADTLNRNWDISTDEDAANVALIVLAVNSYEADQERIRMLTEALEAAALIVGYECSEEALTSTNRLIDAALSQAKAVKL